MLHRCRCIEGRRMSLALWHKCKAMPVAPPVHHSEAIGWFLSSLEGDAVLAIIHCPWCGDRLLAPGEYTKKGIGGCQVCGAHDGEPCDGGLHG